MFLKCLSSCLPVTSLLPPKVGAQTENGDDKIQAWGFIPDFTLSFSLLSLRSEEVSFKDFLFVCLRPAWDRVSTITSALTLEAGLVQVILVLGD